MVSCEREFDSAIPVPDNRAHAERRDKNFFCSCYVVELVLREVQVTMEQLVRRVESSTEHLPCSGA